MCGRGGGGVIEKSVAKKRLFAGTIPICLQSVSGALTTACVMYFRWSSPYVRADRRVAQ